MEILVLYFAVINIVSIVITAVDKYNAMSKKRRKRVPERTLLLLAALGGSIGMYITMLLIHHKTKKPKFMIMLPIIIMIYIAILYAIYTNGGLT